MNSYDTTNQALREEVQRLLDENGRLRLLAIRKNEALSIVADPAMWSKVRYGDDPWFLKWNGAGEFADPMAWAKREAAAEEP